MVQQIQINIFSIDMFDELTVTENSDKANESHKEMRKGIIIQQTEKWLMIDAIDDGWFWLEKPTETDLNQFAAVEKFS